MDVRRLQYGFLAAAFTGLAVLVWWIAQPPAAAVDAAGRSPDATLLAPYPGQAGSTTSGASISGSWIGWLHIGNTQSEFRFTLLENKGRLSGAVRFPVGDGIIETGTLINNAVTLVTVNRLPANDQPLQTQFTGTYEGGLIHLVMQTEAGNVNLTLQRAR